MGRRAALSHHKKGTGNDKAKPCRRKKQAPDEIRTSQPLAEEPELAQQARKKPRSKPPPAPPQPRAPTPRGPPAAKPKRTATAELSPDSLKKRREANRAYAKTAYKKAVLLADAGESAPAAAAYATTKTGRKRKGKGAEQRAKSRAVTKIADAVESLGDEAHQAQGLHDALESRRLRQAAAQAGYVREEQVEVALYHQEQQKKMLSRARATEKPRAGVSDDRKSFARSVLIASAKSPEKATPPVAGSASKPKPAPPARARARALDVPETTFRRQMDTAEKVRIKLSKQEEGVAWSVVERRKGKQKVTPAMREQLMHWILAHDSVVQSPMSNDTLLIFNPESGKKERVGKLLLEVSVRELHNDLISAAPAAGGRGLACARGPPTQDNPEGSILISLTALRYLMPPQCRRMTERHKLMCGCDTCLTAAGTQRSLNAFRVRLKASFVADASKASGAHAKKKAAAKAAAYQPSLPAAPWHLKPALALDEITCPVVAECGFPHWDCVLRRCLNCPKYPIPKEEQGTDDGAPKIKFHIYEIRTVMVKGKEKTRKFLTQYEKPIGVFHRDFYIPALEKLAYHNPHRRILSKDHCGAARAAVFQQRPGDGKTRRDYAERLKSGFTEERHSEHFGNSRELSMEGSSIQTFRATAIKEYENALRGGCSAAGALSAAALAVAPDDTVKMAFFSHLSDDSRQDAATTHAHMTVMVEALKQAEELLEGCTIWDDTDGCAKQYRCGTALHLLSVLAYGHGICIDRAIGAPGHGKDIVDGLNATDKRYLRAKMGTIITPEVHANDGKRMASHAMVDGRAFSLADESKRLLADESRVHGVKGGDQPKRQAAAKMKERRYFVQDPAKVQFTNVSVRTHHRTPQRPPPTAHRPPPPPSRPATRQLKMQAKGFAPGEHNGIIAHYNVRADPKLGVGKVAVRRIPCACAACLQQLARPWLRDIAPENQPRYASSTRCKFWKIFKQGPGEAGLNDWIIVELVPTKKSDPAEEEEVHRVVLGTLTDRMAAKIRKGKVGAMATTDDDADGFYVIDFTSEAYTLQSDVELDEYTPALRIAAGEVVCEAEYRNKVGRAPGWYTKPTAAGAQPLKTIVRVQQVVAADLKLEPISAKLKPPRTCNVKEATRLKAERLTDDDNDLILEEIDRRERIEHDELEEDEQEDESEEDASSEDDASDDFDE